MFDPATVTWDATNCPIGAYTITSTASSLNGTFQATSTGVQLPTGSVTHVFDNLPGGRYTVTAIATDAEGRLFGSGSQTLVVSTPQTNKSSKGHGTSTGAATAQSASTPLKPPPAKVADKAVTGPRVTSEVTSGVLDLAKIADLLGDGSDWRRFDLIDFDEDGAVDELRIEWSSGTVRVWRIVR